MYPEKIFLSGTYDVPKELPLETLEDSFDPRKQIYSVPS